MKNLSRILLITAAFGFLGFAANAQHEEGQSNINLGIGFVTFGLEGDNTIPPISVSYEYGINDNISIGGYLGYTSSEFDAGFYKATYTYMIAAARGSYHKELIDGMDTYVGLQVGYNIASVNYDPDLPAGFPEPSIGGVTFGGFLGGRYHFTDNIGAFLELGYGVSAVNLGVTMRF